MLLSRRFLFAPLLLLASVATMAGQTLEHRPPPTPQPPATPPMAGNTGTQPTGEPVLPPGTNLQVELPRHAPMKAGQPIEGQLLYPLYAGGQLALPRKTPLRGRIVSLAPDSSTRLHARLSGDFTPFHIARVEFTELVLPGGPVPLATTGAVTGTPVLHLAAPGARPHRSFTARAFTQVRNRLRDQVAWFVAPGFRDRALQLLYHQLPWHPERIESHTMWSFDLAAPLALPAGSSAETLPAPAAPAAGKPEIWLVPALLTAQLTSANARPGDPVEALVVEPVFDMDRQLVVPQGSMLVGKVTAARAARSFGRNGKLRFNFQQVRFPEGPGSSVAERGVQGSLAGASAETRQDLLLDAEGAITPRSQSSVIAPLLLTMVAGRALDSDGNLTAQTGVGSNGFGLAGRVAGLAARSRNVAAGIGFYAAGLSVYDNFLRHGRDVTFPRNTRIEIETTPLRAPVLKPNGQ